MFSAKERELFKALGFTDKRIDSYESDPTALYHTALRDPYGELSKAKISVYRCVQSFLYTSLRRNTPEFDALIDV